MPQKRRNNPDRALTEEGSEGSNGKKGPYEVAKPYYYDDSYGYEDFDPDAEPEGEDEDAELEDHF